MATQFGMTGIPGANFGGTNMGVPSPGNSNTPAIGGNSSPFTPSFPSGNTTPPITSTINAAPTSGTTDLSSLFNPSTMFGFGNGTNDPLKDITKALGKAGFSAGVAGELANFLKSGAGFNPAVAQALIAAMQPGVQRKEADLMEQFSGMGLRGSSAAAIGMGDFLSQEQLNEDQVWANLYEQSVQNYLTVLLSGKNANHQSGVQQFGTIASGFSDLLKGGAAAANAAKPNDSSGDEGAAG